MTSLLDITGWTLIHFTWQGALVAAAAAVALRLAASRSATARYAIACAALCVMVAAPIVTASLIATQSPDAASESTQGISIADAPRTAVAWQSPSVREPSRDTTTQSSAIDSQRLVAGLTVAWLAGVVMLLARLCGGWWYVRKLHRIAMAAPASAWQHACERIAGRLHFRAAVHVVESALVDVPTVVGWLRPAIVLPIAALATLTPAQVEAILAHELAHIRRHDYAVNLLQTLTETLLFYHPAVWWLSHRVRAERENCCDDVAVAVCGDPVEYARALADLETSRASYTMALAATDGSLVERIGRILRAPRDDARSPRWAATLILTLLFGAGAGSIERLPRFHMSAQTVQTAAVPRVRVESASPQPPVPPARPSDVFDSVPPVPPEPPEPLSPPEPPSPPVPPAPPAPPAPPSPPAPPALSQRGDWTMSWSNDHEHVDFHLHGSVTFTDDLTDVKSLSDDGDLTIREWHGVIPHTIEIRSSGGSLTRTYYVAGVKHGWDAEATAVLRDLLPRLVRNSGLGAESRVKSILAAKGVPGVLAEIGLITSDYARRVYYVNLVDQAHLDAAGVLPILSDAGARIRSDYERGQILQHVAVRVKLDERAASAYVKAMGGMRSDYERRRALTALFAGGGAAVGPTAFQAIDPITSAYERRQVLADLIARGALSDEMKRGVLVSARTISSDYERREVLTAYISAYGVESAVRVPFFSAVSAFTSDYERRMVLMAVANHKPAATDVQQAALDATMAMRSDYDRAETLLAFLNARALDSSSRQAFVDAADRIKSSYDQNRVLAALARSERR